MNLVRRIILTMAGKNENRKDSKRSSLRKQLFYEKQLQTMGRWQQTALIGWK